MKFSWNWLNQTLDLNNISLDEIINKLTLAGFEIEDILDQPKIQDKTIDLSITSNRADVNNMIGLGREISSILNCKLLNNNIHIKNIYPKIYSLKENDIISNSILDIRSNTLRNLTPKTSPSWLIKHLKGCNIQPNNIINDIINYINIKWGQDIEAFDLDKIIKQDIEYSEKMPLNFELLKLNQDKYKLLGFQTSTLLNDIHVMTYNNKILSIIGLESNYQFCCDQNTSSIIIISKIYKPQYIHSITYQKKNKTDISNKHLKGISRNDFIHAYEEIIYLFKNLNNNHILGPLFEYSKKKEIEKTIYIDQKNINNILGTIKGNNEKYINQEKIINILERLNFQPQYKNNIFSVKIPEYRSRDISRPIDVIEEIARIYGFKQFIDKIPENNLRGNTSDFIIFIKKIRSILRNMGLHEVIHYSLEKPKTSEFLNKNQNIVLQNPLLEEQSQLRNHLVSSLIDTIKYNKNNQNSALECFEIGKIFKNQQDNEELIYLTSLMGNPNFSKNIWTEKNKSMNWFQAKGLLEIFFEKLEVQIKWCTKDIFNNTSKISTYIQTISHPYRIAILLNQKTEEKIGIFFQLNAKLQDEINVDYEIYICELNIFNLMKSIKYKKHLDYNFTDYSNYPSVTRDISYVLNKNDKISKIKQYISSIDNSLIESVEILNEYTKISMHQGEDQRIIGLRITYRSNNRTLNDQDIKNIDLEIKHLLKKKII